MRLPGFTHLTCDTICSSKRRHRWDCNSTSEAAEWLVTELRELSSAIVSGCHLRMVLTTGLTQNIWSVCLFLAGICRLLGRWDMLDSRVLVSAWMPLHLPNGALPSLHQGESVTDAKSLACPCRHDTKALQAAAMGHRSACSSDPG